MISDSRGKWDVYTSEYPWRRFQGQDDLFLDIVAFSREIILTIECKKSRHETWTFLGALGRYDTGKTKTFRCVHPDHVTRTEQRLYCETWEFEPASLCSAFCIVGTSKSGKDQRLLERDAGLLIGATDAFSRDRSQGPSKLRQTLQARCLVIPVIVTNAKLYFTRYEPTEISLESGEFEESPEIENAHWIRFSKTFTAGGDAGTRTIFIVHAVHLREFLDLLTVSTSQPIDKTRIQL